MSIVKSQRVTGIAADGFTNKVGPTLQTLQSVHMKKYNLFVVKSRITKSFNKNMFLLSHTNTFTPYMKTDSKLAEL